MGVDATMLVKVQGTALSERAVKRLGYKMASALGHQTFFITRKDPGADEYSRNLDYRALSIIPTYTKEDADGDEHDAELRKHIGKVVWFQDGDPVVAKRGEQFLKVGLYGRYYGPGYERGDWPKLRAVIAWLYANIATCEVWYGGDSSGCCVEHMTAERIVEIDDHFNAAGHAPYVGGFSALGKSSATQCPTCDEPMRSSGGGRDYDFQHCDGCGAACVTNGRMIEWSKKNEEIFKTAERFRASPTQPAT